MKRVIDLLLALLLLLLLSPFLLLVACLIRLKLGGPVIFTQERGGYMNKTFKIYKFRTMLEAYDAQGEPLPDAQRLTPFGIMLRKLSIDELPQLINIIKGEMSIVGPRPFVSEYLDLYTASQSTRHHVRPGVTGWAQVNGRNSISWKKKFALDVWYVQNHSLFLDFYILLKTIKIVLSRHGISADGEATVQKYQGPVKRFLETRF